MRVKNSQTWRKHLPATPRRTVSTNYYSGLAGRQKSRIKKIILIIFILLLIQSIFQTKLFRLTEVKLETNQDLTLEEIRPIVDEVLNQRRFLIFKNNNYWLFKQQDLGQQLRDQYNLETVEITKDFPHTLQLILTERVSKFIWQRGSDLYLLDNKGQITRQISEISSEYLVLEDQRSNPPTEGQILSSEALETINRLIIAWNQEMPSLRLAKVVLGEDQTTLRAQTEIGYYLIFDPADDFSSQINNLKKVLAGNIVGQDIDYIDLRFGDRVFFK